MTHTIEAMTAWIGELLTPSGVPPAQIAVGIETPRGLVVETLIERRFAVLAINPKQLDRFRDRFTAAGAKDDRREAHVLSDAVRTDRGAFRRVQLDDPLVQELRELAAPRGGHRTSAPHRRAAAALSTGDRSRPGRDHDRSLVGGGIAGAS